MAKILYNFEAIQTYCDCALKKLKDNGFEPTMIIGIERGGLVPAVYVSHRLGCDFTAFRWSTRDHEKRDPITKLNNLLEQGHRLLIVEDIVDTGKTLQEIQTAISSSDNVKYMAVIQKEVAEVKADFVGSSVDFDMWVVFPWEEPAPIITTPGRFTI